MNPNMSNIVWNANFPNQDFPASLAIIKLDVLKARLGQDGIL